MGVLRSLLARLPWTPIAGLLPSHDPADLVQVVVRGSRGDVVQTHVRSCVIEAEREMAVAGRWQIVVRRRPSRSGPGQAHDVLVQFTTGGVTIRETHQDPDVILAVRGAFMRIREAHAKAYERSSPTSAAGCPWRPSGRV